MGAGTFSRRLAFIGITLLGAVTAAAAGLRLLARRTGRRDPVPATIRRLGVLFHRAVLADAGQWDPELEDDPVPPPLLKPTPGHLVFGTAPSGENEAVLDPRLHTLTVYAGPGAHPAAAALALSALSCIPAHRLVTTTELARTLLGIEEDPAGALQAAVGPAIEGPTLVISDAADASTLQISRALAADDDQKLTIVLLGDAAHLPELARTTIDIAEDGAVLKATGKLAAAFTRARVHLVPPETAAEIYQALRHDRTAKHAAADRPTHESEPADEDDHAATFASAPVPAPAEEPATTLPAGEVAQPLLLRILGSTTAENPVTGAGLDRPWVGRVAELLTYLAAHPKGAPLSRIVGAIWDGESEGGAKSGIVRIRRELRHAITALAPDLQPDPTRQVDPVPQNKHGAYYLDPRLVTTDFEAFHRIEAAARQAKDPAVQYDLATRALALYRGQPAAGTPADELPWLAELRRDLARRVTALEAMMKEPVACGQVES